VVLALERLVLLLDPAAHLQGLAVALLQEAADPLVQVGLLLAQVVADNETRDLYEVYFARNRIGSFPGWLRRW
jgi:hypothetical protein